MLWDFIKSLAIMLLIFIGLTVAVVALFALPILFYEYPLGGFALIGVVIIWASIDFMRFCRKNYGKV